LSRRILRRLCQPPDGDLRDAVAARDGRSRYRRPAIWNGAGAGRAQSTLVQPCGSVGAVGFSMAQLPLPHSAAIAAPVLITSAKAADNRSRFMFMTRCSFRDPVAWVLDGLTPSPATPPPAATAATFVRIRGTTANARTRAPRPPVSQNASCLVLPQRV
jgi:hypothetical protein